MFVSALWGRGRPVGSTLFPLPNHFEASIEVERMVASEHGDVLRESLRDDLAIKRIGVVRRQSEQTKRVLGSVRQDAKAKLLDSLSRYIGGELEFSSRTLDGDFRKRYCAELQDIRRIL
jgi:hypothetical protein